MPPWRHTPRVELRAAVLSVVVAVTLMGLKFAAYFITGSTAILSDALESIVNVVAAGFATYSLMLAHTPADPEHPYGHGKIEFLSAAFEGGMICIAAIVIIATSVSAILQGPVVEDAGIGLLLIAVAMAVHGVVGLYLIRLGKRRHSLTLEADGKHLLSDAITSAMTFVALAVVRWTGWTYADPIGALAMAGYIGYMGVGLVRRASGGLMDEQEHADTLLLESILNAHLAPDGRPPHICSYHKVRHRHSGRYHWVDFHLMLPAQLTIEQGHEIASAIELEIEKELGGNATAHIEPCPQAGCATCTPAAEDNAK